MGSSYGGYNLLYMEQSHLGANSGRIWDRKYWTDKLVIALFKACSRFVSLRSLLYFFTVFLFQDFQKCQFRMKSIYYFRAIA